MPVCGVNHSDFDCVDPLFVYTWWMVEYIDYVVVVRMWLDAREERERAFDQVGTSFVPQAFPQLL